MTCAPPCEPFRGLPRSIVDDYEEALDDLGQDYIHRVAASAEHLDVLVQEPADYSRLGRASIHLQPVNLDRLIHSILEEFARHH